MTFEKQLSAFFLFRFRLSRNRFDAVQTDRLVMVYDTIDSENIQNKSQLSLKIILESMIMEPTSEPGLK